MSAFIKRTGLVSAVVALAAVAACSKDRAEIDPSLKADLAAVGGGTAGDLELAPSSTKSLVVVSAIEGGPQAAPKRAAPVLKPRPTVKKAPPAPVRQAPAAAPTVVAAEQAPTPEPEQPAIRSTRQAPTPAPQQDHRVYKTEAEVFRQMPWIRP